MTEIYWAITQSGERHQCITPWKASTILDRLKVPGEVVRENPLRNPATETLARRNADGSWETVPYDGPPPDPQEPGT